MAAKKKATAKKKTTTKKKATAKKTTAKKAAPKRKTTKGKRRPVSFNHLKGQHKKLEADFEKLCELLEKAEENYDEFINGKKASARTYRMALQAIKREIKPMRDNVSEAVDKMKPVYAD